MTANVWFLGLLTDVRDLADNISMDATNFSFVIIVLGICTHMEHVIDQETRA